MTNPLSASLHPGHSMAKCALLLSLLSSGCASVAEGRIDSRVASSPAVQVHDRTPPPPAATPDTALLAQMAKGGTVSLAQLIDFALRTSPTTRASWADARAAAAVVGSKQSSWYPELDVAANLSYAHTVLSRTLPPIETKSWGPSAQLTWLLLDLGGRSADISEARALLAAANDAHDKTVQDLVLRVEQAYTQYQGARALLAAQQVSVREARTVYDAADARRQTGLATVADVLQAKTALSQAQLNLQSLDGQVAVLRGAVATAVGVPANVPVEAEELPRADIEQQLTRVDELIAQAEKERPDLSAARATALAAQSHAESIRSRGLPQLVLNANAGRVYYITSGAPYGDNYGASLQLRFPLFTGFRDSFDAAQAEEQAKAAAARAESVEQQAILEVWTSYQGVRTAVQRVRTALDLLQAAQQSADVAQGRYKEGVGSILDVLTAQSALAAARAQEVQARADWRLSVAALAHDTGALGPMPNGEKR